MHENLFNHIDIKRNNINIPEGFLDKKNIDRYCKEYEKNIESLLAENTMRAETLVNLDQEASEKVLKIMNFMDDLDDVQEVHTNAEFPDNFTFDE